MIPVFQKCNKQPNFLLRQVFFIIITSHLTRQTLIQHDSAQFVGPAHIDPHLKTTWLTVRFLGFGKIVLVHIEDLFEVSESHHQVSCQLKTCTESVLAHQCCASSSTYYSTSPVWKSFNLKRFAVENKNSISATNSLLFSCLLLAGDIECNPGPPVSFNQSVTDAAEIDGNSNPDIDFEDHQDASETVYFCGACKEPVTWDQKGLMCEHPTCETWYHIDCQAVGESTYEHLGNSDFSWTCLVCDGPNYSTTLFDLHSLHLENRYASLSNLTDLDTSDCSSLSFDSLNSENFTSQPRATSSPSKPKPRSSTGHRPNRVLNVNCQALGNKKGPFYNLVDSTKPDIIIATETWFNSGVADSEFFDSQFTVHRRDRATHAGGVIVAVNSDFISTREESLEREDTESVWVKLNISGCKTLLVGGIYCPNVSDVINLEAFDAAVSKISGKANSILLIGGDFNFPGWDWKNKTLKPKTPHVNLHYRFADILADNGLSQIIEEPTRGRNTLDLIITNRPCQINRAKTLPGISDHSAVYVEFDIKPTRKKQIPRDVPLYKKADWERLLFHRQTS